MAPASCRRGGTTWLSTGSHDLRCPKPSRRPLSPAITACMPTSFINMAVDKPLLCLVAPSLEPSPKMFLLVLLQPMGFNSCVSSISRGFARQMTGGFATISSHLAAGLLVLQGWDFTWWRRKRPDVWLLCTLLMCFLRWPSEAHAWVPTPHWCSAPWFCFSCVSPCLARGRALRPRRCHGLWQWEASAESPLGLTPSHCLTVERKRSEIHWVK